MQNSAFSNAGFCIWNLADQNHSFSIGFIRYFDLAKTYVGYSEKRNAFLMILEPFFDFGLGKASLTISLIRYFATLFSNVEKLVLPLFYKGLPRFAKVGSDDDFYL